MLKLEVLTIKLYCTTAGLNYQETTTRLSVLSEEIVCLRFSFIDQDNYVEYQEMTTVKTDVMGTVNLIVGKAAQTAGYADGFNGIQWKGDAKNLEVEVDITGSWYGFEFVSSEPYLCALCILLCKLNPGPQGNKGQRDLRVYKAFKVYRVSVEKKVNKAKRESKCSWIIGS